VTTINGHGKYDKVVSYSGTANAIIAGFRITGSSDTPFWATSGLYCLGGSLVIRNNIIKGNYAGICVQGAGTRPTIINNTVVSKQNGIVFGSRGTSLLEKTHTIMNNIVVGNTGIGIAYYHSIGESEDSYFGDFIEDNEIDSPVASATQEMLKDRIDVVLKTLSYREREIIKLRYGIGDGYTYTLEEVGRIFKVTRERVRQVEAKAIRKLQHPVRSRKLEGFMDHKTA
jgi:RNA polymerase sigma factor (sigma-70 family)